jgi:hypothetical protein
VQQWEEQFLQKPTINGCFIQSYIAAQAAQWGADQELEACCHEVQDMYSGGSRLRAARRPKPPSLKAQALKRLESLEKLAEACGHDSDDTIRRALEALDD